MTDVVENETVPANLHVFAVPNTDNTQMQIDIAQIPDGVRLDMLKKAIEAYVKNSVNQANIRHTKAMEPWAAYDKACAADPAQTVVAAPTGDRPVVDLVEVAKTARQRLYSGNVKKTGQRAARKTADPLTTMVTNAVIRELFEKSKDTTPGYKWTDAVKAVGGDGIAYLNNLITAKVAAGADLDQLEKFMESRYIQPAKLMLGQRDTAGTKGVDLIG